MKILNVKYDNMTFGSAIEEAVSLLRKEKKSNLFFLNADCLYKAQKDEEYRNILNSADLVLPDGIGLKLITMLFGVKMKDNCNGTDFSPIFMEKAAAEGYKIFFLGGKENIAEKAAENVRHKILGIKIVGIHSGYFSDDKKVIDKINNSGADILFVAMGAPLQEKWIARHREKLNTGLCLGVGALFDYLSERVRRAPKIMRNLYLEWLWRIFIDPKRMFKRYIIDGSKFFWLVLKQRFGILG